MKRSYSIKIYGKTVKTVGGEKAGRFYSNGTISHSSNKNALETVTKRNKRISKVFRPINKRRSINKIKTSYNIALNRFKICFCLILLAGAIHSGYIESQTVENIESSDASDVPDEVPSMVLTSFESADIPADYKEPDLYDKYFKSEARLARAICQAENKSQDPNAINYANKDGSFDTGLCQINSIHIGKVDGNLELLKDPETNIRVAKQIRDESGWTAWTQYKNGEYLEFY